MQKYALINCVGLAEVSVFFFCNRTNFLDNPADDRSSEEAGHSGVIVFAF